MKREQHDGRSLKYVTVLPDDYNPELSYPLIIMLHGFGAHMDDLAGLAPAIETKGYVYACPNAPLAFDFGGGHTGYGWMPRRDTATPEELSAARANSETLLADFFGEITEKLNTAQGQAILLGFSQGGGMTYRCGLNRPETFAGLALLSALLPDPNDLNPNLPAERTQPLFVAHGTGDQQIAVETARTAREFLEAEGYQPEYHEYNMGHEIPFEVLQDLIPWMVRALPPLRD